MIHYTKDTNMILSSILYIFGSICWLISLFTIDKQSVLVYDTMAAISYIIGSILLFAQIFM